MPEQDQQTGAHTENTRTTPDVMLEQDQQTGAHTEKLQHTILHTLSRCDLYFFFSSLC